MTSILCGHCGQTHGSVAEVRECAGLAPSQTPVVRAQMPEEWDAGHYGPILAQYAEPEPQTRRSPVTSEGYFKSADNEIVKVQRSQTSGRLYGKMLVAQDSLYETDEPKVWTFEYRPGLLTRIFEEDRLSKDDAAEFGRLYGVCCICGRTLTNEESIAAGIGPICAGKQGWR